MGKNTNRTTDSTYLLHLARDDRQRLHDKAKRAGVPLSEAMRIGTEQYLDGLLEAGTDPLMSEFRAVASRIESRLRDGR